MIKIVIAGDFTTCNRAKNINIGIIDDKICNKIKCADLSIINFEAPIIKEEKKSYRIQKVGPHIHNSPNSIKILKDIGFDLFTLANNHILDYGIKGLNNTIEDILKNQLHYVGAGRNNKEKSSIYYFNKENISLAILNYCESEFSVHDNYGANPISPIKIYYDILAAKKKAQYIIIITHGGHEGYNLPSPKMKELFRYFIDIGADFVINHHQHCYSGFESYNNGKIYYGLGNFFFDNNQSKPSIWNEGFLVEIELEEKSKQSLEIPYTQCKNNELKVKSLSKNEIEKFYININDLNSIIASPKELNEKFNLFSRKKQKDELCWLSPYSNRILLALCRRKLLPSFLTAKKRTQLLNMLRCESHNNLCINILKKL